MMDERFRVVAFFKRSDGSWYGIASRYYVDALQPVLSARDILERHNATQQHAAVAIIDGQGVVVWQGATRPGDDIRTQTTARSRFGQRMVADQMPISPSAARNGLA